ncbi:NnrU family protein [Mangrovicoccus ximenensis]|uniref:NnrU family protein n=1 Tax=Mangrovicoccus ximenensis TaxID=1911570 RepID=UPI000D36E30A|nr:NnrU family protein [Mangrovicoccus ximenensis]
MTGWTEFALALALFAGSHFLSRIGGLRGMLIGMAGRRAYFAAYGVMSVALLVWVISAALRAPYAELWPQLPWMRWIPNIAMPAAVVLASCGFRLRQPFTLGARRCAAFDPHDPGFAAISRHPLLLALGLWAGAHLVPNGDVAMAVLFGSFLVMAAAAIPAFDAKARRVLGGEAGAFFGCTSILSLKPLVHRGWLRRNGRATAPRALVGLLLWVVLLHLHGPVIGASPFPL